MLLQVSTKRFPEATERRNRKSLFWVQSVLMERSHIDPSDRTLSLGRLQWGYSHYSLSSLVPITRASSHLIFNPQMPSSLYSTPVLKLTPIWAVSQRLYQSPDQQDKDWAALWLIAVVIQGQRAHRSKSHQSLKGLWEMVIWTDDQQGVCLWLFLRNVLLKFKGSLTLNIYIFIC